MNAQARKHPQGKSPEKRNDQVLGVLSVEEAKDFLVDSLNLPWAAVDRPDNMSRHIRYRHERERSPETPESYRSVFNVWLNRWQKFFTFRTEDQVRPIPRDQVEKFALKLRTVLRTIWYEKDPRQRDWFFYRLRDDYHRMIVHAEHPYLVDLTDPKAVERLIQLEHESRARGVADASQRAYFFERFAVGTDLLEDVPRPEAFEAAAYWLQVNQPLMVYCEGPTCPAPYFFRTEKGQRYCSPECAHPARRAAKLKWWNDNRKNQRKRKSP